MTLLRLSSGLLLVFAWAPLSTATAALEPTPLRALSTIPDLKGLQREFRAAKHADIRLNLLEKMAAAPEGKSEPDLVAGALGKGLKDDSLHVRAKAATLLGEMADSEAALLHLVKSASEIGRVFEDVKDVKSLKVPKLGEKDTVKKLDEMSAALKVRADRMKGLVAYHTALVDGLLRRRDDRCVAGLGALLDVDPLSPSTWRINERLFELGTVPAIQEVMDLFSYAEDLLKLRTKTRKKMAREKPAKVPKYWKGTKESWNSREGSRINGKLKQFDEGTERFELWRAELAERVNGLAKTAQLAPAPLTPKARAWAKWWREQKPQLPTSLGE